MAEQRAQKKMKNRRRSADAVVKAAGAFGGIAWVLFFFAASFFLLTQPVIGNNAVLTTLGVRQASEGWNIPDLKLAFFLLAVSIAACMTGIFFNMARRKRRSDKYKKSLVLFTLICTASCLWFLIRFGIPL